MTTVIASLLVLCILPLACAWISAYHKQKQLGSVDNKEPRTQATQLTGPGARAVAAQGNSWEALAIFSAAILALVIAGVDLATISTQALVYTALRIVYIPLYVGNIDKARSLVFIAGFGICLYFFYLALTH
ncbi:MAG: MAPEG family protein [Halioglobus sp.]|nr:MAPEG family protein [Halioglobus sp.]